MARYLVVADQTATSPELLRGVRALATGDTTAEFVLLVPATPFQRLFTWDERETRRLARERAEIARARLEEIGAKIIAARVGDASPLLAIADEMREHTGYDAIIISTFPPGVSRWLRLDLPCRIKRQYSIPVIHVVAQRRPPSRPERRGRKVSAPSTLDADMVPTRVRDLREH
ncbi:MAG: hypothetical protein ACE5KW_06035 [Dehalococcoidia bacterium]